MEGKLRHFLCAWETKDHRGLLALRQVERPDEGQPHEPRVAVKISLKVERAFDVKVLDPSGRKADSSYCRFEVIGNRSSKGTQMSNIRSILAMSSKFVSIHQRTATVFQSHIVHTSGALETVADSHQLYCWKVQVDVIVGQRFIDKKPASLVFYFIP